MTTTTKEKHTPGPWIRNGDSIQNPASLEMVACSPSYLPEVYDGSHQQGDWTANSCLLTAAPDLLMACEAALLAVNPYSTVKEDLVARSKLLNAIAKARGGLT